MTGADNVQILPVPGRLVIQLEDPVATISRHRFLRQRTIDLVEALLKLFYLPVHEVAQPRTKDPAKLRQFTEVPVSLPYRLGRSTKISLSRIFGHMCDLLQTSPDPTQQ